MAETQTLRVAVEPAEVYRRLASEVAESYWFDVLNWLFARQAFVGFLGIRQSTIWRNGFRRSANYPRLHVRVEPTRHGCRIEYHVEPPWLGDLFMTMKEDEGPLLALLPRLFAEVHIDPHQPSSEV